LSKVVKFFLSVLRRWLEDTKMNSVLTANDRFDGEFDFLPFDAHVRYGAVPEWPVEADFHNAVSVAFHERRPSAVWRKEAVRWRLHNGGKALDLKTIASATAKALYDLARAER
jgi:hypothetical protein